MNVRRHQARMRRMQRRAEIWERYASGLSLREVADEFGISFQRVHQIIEEDAPQTMRVPYDTTQNSTGKRRKA